MNRYLIRLHKEHQRLNSLIDNCQHAFAGQSEIKSLKRLRLRIKDKIEALRRKSASAAHS